MLIDESRYPLHFTWEGRLVRPTGYLTGPDLILPVVGIAKPAWWSGRDVLDPGLPEGPEGKRYGLARFAFVVRPEARLELNYVEFIVYLQAGEIPSPRRPLFYDLFPKSVAPENVGVLAASLGPKLRFTAAPRSPKPPSTDRIETTVVLQQAVPISIADGIGDSTARWQFVVDRAGPPVGTQVVYAIIELPAGIEAASITVQLLAEVGDRITSVRGFMPKSERSALSWTLR